MIPLINQRKLGSGGQKVKKELRELRENWEIQEIDEILESQKRALMLRAARALRLRDPRED